MKLQRVAVLGGGPGGLYAARLFKRAHPDADVVVYEQTPPEETFGFGVGLAARTQKNLEAADAETYADIVGAAYGHAVEMRVGGRSARISGNRLIAIGRSELLRILFGHAERAGVRLVVGDRCRPEDLDADLVVAADGVSSETREAHAEALGAEVALGRGRFLWCGADFALETAMFLPETSEAGTFVTHAYPYAPDRSTFLVETDEETFCKGGFDVFDAETEPGASDERSLDVLSAVFSATLRGHRLIGNRTRWRRFPTVTCARWSVGRVVLLGDAAHTAHYSIGSGTKIAMEDAIALVEATVGEPSLEGALARYEAARRPEVSRLQDLAQRSELWWESFPERMHLPVEQLMLAYMTRAGNVPLERLAARNPELVQAGLGQFAGIAPAEVPQRGLTPWIEARRPTEAVGPHVDLPVSDAYATEAALDALVERARSAERRVLRLTGADDRPSVLTRLELAERLRRRVAQAVVVAGPAACRDDLAAGLACDRVDDVPGTSAEETA